MSRSRATYRGMRKWVLQNYGFEPETCWIAHSKELHGLPLGATHNRSGYSADRVSQSLFSLKELAN